MELDEKPELRRAKPIQLSTDFLDESKLPRPTACLQRRSTLISDSAGRNDMQRGWRLVFFGNRGLGCLLLFAPDIDD